MACQWELFRNTRAPMPSQRTQVQLCKCRSCHGARSAYGLGIRPGDGIRTVNDEAERLAVLAWKPEPPPEPERAA